MQLFGVKLPQITKQHLLQKIENLDKNEKQSLYFLYSEFLLRANRNPSYKSVLQDSRLSVIDGRGLNSCLWRILNPGKVPKWWIKTGYKLPFLFRIIVFLLLFSIELLVNLVVLSTSLLQKQDLSEKINNELILGRNFIYDILEAAERKNWKTLILGGSIKTQNLILQKFPNLDLKLWFKPFDSDLMRDKPVGEFFDFKQKLYSFFQVFFGVSLEILKKFGLFKKNYQNKQDEKDLDLTKKIQVKKQTLTQNKKFDAKNFEKLYGINYPDSHTWLNRQNLFELFPNLKEAKEIIKIQKPDIILVCLGGSSGKQEFLVDNFCKDKKLEFRLAVGFGAAIDHLGAGALQKVAPIWMQKIGLEWLHRLINQPYRRFRILDSVLSLWWWLTLSEFMNNVEQKPRQTAIVIVENLDQEILVVRRKNWLPGDVGWTFVQGKIEEDEEITSAAIREVAEETNLDQTKILANKQVLKGSLEIHTISFFRFILNRVSQSASQNQIIFLKYQGKEILRSNWENMEIRWVKKESLENLLSPEKKLDWEIWKKHNISN